MIQLFKGDPNGRHKLALRCRKLQIFSCACSVNINAANWVILWFKFELIRAQPVLVGSLPMKTNEELKKLPRDVIGFCATHAGLVHDVADTKCQTLNGTTHGCVFANFKRRFLTNETYLNWKTSLSLFHVLYVLVYSDRVASSPGVLFKCIVRRDYRADTLTI